MRRYLGPMAKQRKLQVQGRFWIGSDHGIVLGPGRVELLEHIDELGSINKAAAAMEMSYRQAWGLVKSMNERAHAPLVVRTAGGKEGGGTHLTDAGRKALQLYREIGAELQHFYAKANARIGKI